MTGNLGKKVEVLGANIARYHKKKPGQGKYDSEYSLTNKVCEGVSYVN